MTAARYAHHRFLQRAEQAAGLAFGFDDGPVLRPATALRRFVAPVAVAVTATGAAFAATFAWAL
ncbi:MAG: hypothetical protein PGN34_11885 [Methylobacterium frigidaeris]